MGTEAGEDAAAREGMDAQRLEGGTDPPGAVSGAQACQH